MYKCKWTKTYLCKISDLDECKENKDICGGRKCTNTPGAYRCICVGGLKHICVKFQILKSVRRIKIYVAVVNVQILLEHIDVYV